MDRRMLARQVIETWNSHDLDRFMSLHSEGFRYSSPVIRKLTGKDIDTLTDKAQIRKLWQSVLERIPDIRSEILDMLEGTDSVAVYYRSSAKERNMVDVMTFDESGLVSRLEVFYG